MMNAMNEQVVIDWQRVADAVRELSVHTWSERAVAAEAVARVSQQTEPTLEDDPSPLPTPALQEEEESVMPFPEADPYADPFSEWTDETALRSEAQVEGPAATAARPTEPAPPRPSSGARLTRSHRPAPLPAIPRVFGGSAPLPAGDQVENKLSDLQGFDWD